MNKVYIAYVRPAGSREPFRKHFFPECSTVREVYLFAELAFLEFDNTAIFKS